MPAMKQVFDAFWRAAAYCLHPRVIALSLLPLVIMVALALGLGYFFWTDAIAAVNAQLLQSDWLSRGIGWLEGVGFGGLKSAIAPLAVLLIATPVVIIGSLLFVAFLMTPAMISLVGERRFSQLERKKGAGIATSVAWSLGATLLALVALIISVPLWLIPPLVLIIPPLIWGWLTYRVMAFDALSDHASVDERRKVMKENRTQLLGMGVICGYLGAAPTLLWASGVMFIVFAPFLITAAIWLYTLVFAFSSLWFAHFCLDALNTLRSKQFFEQKVPSVVINPHVFAPNSVAKSATTETSKEASEKDAATITDATAKKLP
jgi:hypothetical protein